MKVSVILISYNQQQYIRQAIESILMQTFDGKVEVIIADDCSTDSTFDIIKEYESKSPFPFVYLPHEKNVGMKKNYQRAFAACSGDYVAILEGDDWWSSEDHLKQHVSFLQSHKKTSMSFNRLTLYRENDNKYELANYPFPKDFFLYSLEDTIIIGDVTVNLSSCVFRNSLIQQLPDTFFELNFADWELSMWMAQFGKIAYLKESTSVYRINSQGQWTSLQEEEKTRSIMETLESMNIFFEYKYDKLFSLAIFNSKNNIQPIPYMSWKTKLKRLLCKSS